MPGPGGDPWWPVRDRFDGRFFDHRSGTRGGQETCSPPLPALAGYSQSIGSGGRFAADRHRDELLIDRGFVLPASPSSIAPDTQSEVTAALLPSPDALTGLLCSAAENGVIAAASKN